MQPLANSHFLGFDFLLPIFEFLSPTNAALKFAKCFPTLQEYVRDEWRSDTLMMNDRLLLDLKENESELRPWFIRSMMTLKVLNYRVDRPAHACLNSASLRTLTCVARKSLTQIIIRGCCLPDNESEVTPLGAWILSLPEGNYLCKQTQEMRFPNLRELSVLVDFTRSTRLQPHETIFLGLNPDLAPRLKHVVMGLPFWSSVCVRWSEESLRGGSWSNMTRICGLTRSLPGTRSACGASPMRQWLEMATSVQCEELHVEEVLGVQTLLEVLLFSSAFRLSIGQLTFVSSTQSAEAELRAVRFLLHVAGVSVGKIDQLTSPIWTQERQQILLQLRNLLQMSLETTKGETNYDNLHVLEQTISALETGFIGM
eukprot:Gregarina_sp_Poly_1__3637@NODE_2070_length_2738_cov_113_921003_g1335_i0_p2_GENE_NODE_2070_length_2738_cov_113_921003_g1335_i0NODE_2070_length_2738_cov_113_921003_g1335_i0_p2_ORF_typecomplete_len370_score50_33Septum_form/PF13845_6/2_2e02Septum_form/PF13845_6/2_4_NODE_2070_length_2738_cov_113_921003_g1335_i012662375